MPGAISISLEREPNFHLGAAIEGDIHQVFVGRLPGDARLVGLGSRAVRNAWINGEVRRLGYMGQARVDVAYRHIKGKVAAAFKMFREMHYAADNTPYYIGAIIADNEVAKRLFTTNKPGMPICREWAGMSTLALPLWRRYRIPVSDRYTVRQASREDLPEIVDCLARNYAKFQFAPEWTADDLTNPERTRGLSIENFRVAVKDGKIIGCLAIWDQQGYKQTVVRAYKGPVRVLRFLINLAAPLLGIPRLPPAGNPFSHAYLSHVAVDDLDGEVLRTLVANAVNASAGQGYDYLTIGFAQRNPQLDTVKRNFRHIEYRSIICVFHFEDGVKAVDELDDRIPHVEIAVL